VTIKKMRGDMERYKIPDFYFSRIFNSFILESD